ncbi:MAG: DUF5519 family protein [Chloroflexi bacterium]|nr:DUF5519 family protein [Chloroflexota bacterium]
MLRTAWATWRVWWVVVGIWVQRALLGRTGGRDAPAPSIVAQIRDAALSWPGVTEQPHRFGGIEFRLGRIELGHLHGDYLADLPFPVRVRRELVAAGRAMPHHILPASGWVSYPIRDAAAVPGAIALFRLAYDRAAARKRDA